MTLREAIAEAKKKKQAIGHFNFSNLEGLKAIVSAAEEEGVPVMVGLSEGELDHVGLPLVMPIVNALRGESQTPIFVNADHVHSLDGVKKAIDAGFDSVLVDGSALSLEENISMSKSAVEYARSSGKDVLVEGEMGFIGSSSKLLDSVPEGAQFEEGSLTTAEAAIHFVKETGVDLFAPAVGAIHGVLKNTPNPAVNIKRIEEIASSVGAPIVLHGGSGLLDENIREAIKSGVAVVHVNTELRLAMKQGITSFLSENSDEIAPYKYMRAGQVQMQKVAASRMRLFKGLS